MNIKSLSIIALFSLFVTLSTAQGDIDALLTAGVNNANRFANDYLSPATNGLIHSMNANWFNTGSAKPLDGFEISMIANASIISNKNKSFLMNIADYNNDSNQDFTIAFADQSNLKQVGTALGENNPNVDIIITYQDQLLGEQQETITLPNGIGSESANLLPTAFIQGAIGIGSGIELKARFVPKIDTDEVSLSMYGGGLQFEMTKWLPAHDVLPVAVSGLVAYTHLNGTYNLTETSGIDGDDQRLENNINTWLFQLIGSTKLKVINFYGGLGYITGKSESDLFGTYTIEKGPLLSQTVINPFSISSQVSSLRGTVGTKLKLGFFRLNAEYHLSRFNTFSVGVNFGFR